MASVLSGILFSWRGEPEVAASGGRPCRHLLGETVQKRRSGGRHKAYGSGFKASSLQIFAWNFKIKTFVWVKITLPLTTATDTTQDWEDNQEDKLPLLKDNWNMPMIFNKFIILYRWWTGQGLSSSQENKLPEESSSTWLGVHIFIFQRAMFWRPITNGITERASWGWDWKDMRPVFNILFQCHPAKPAVVHHLLAIFQSYVV